MLCESLWYDNFCTCNLDLLSSSLLNLYSYKKKKKWTKFTYDFICPLYSQFVLKPKFSIHVPSIKLSSSYTSSYALAPVWICRLCIRLTLMSYISLIMLNPSKFQWHIISLALHVTGNQMIKTKMSSKSLLSLHIHVV